MSFTVAVIVIPRIIIIIIIIIIIVVVVFVITTSAAGAVAKYCDEYACLCVCLSATVSQEPHARSLPNFLCTLPMSVSRSSSGTLTIGRIAYGWRRECTARAKCNLRLPCCCCYYYRCNNNKYYA